jgi:hypothetical protein
MRGGGSPPRQKDPVEASLVRYSRLAAILATPKNSEGWEFGKAHVYPDIEKRRTAAHEIGGHAVDLCLGRASESTEFKQAWEYDLTHSYPYPNDSEQEQQEILGNSMNPVIGPVEIWATFMEFALTGKYLRHSAHHFSTALKNFNKQCAGLDIPVVSVVKYVASMEINGQMRDIPWSALSRSNDPFVPPSPERPLACPKGLAPGASTCT